MRTVEASSFRDTAGFIFRHDGVVFRQVNRAYSPHWTALQSSGLAKELQSAGLLIEHEDAPDSDIRGSEAIAVIRPRPVPFISYPYEWCFSQLKDAALCTLEIHKRALEKGMCLKDASSYNIQFVGGKPVLIDTLSFELYEEGQPWQAYRQFCRHFLAPLALMAYIHPEMGLLLRPHLDGVPLEMASQALPWRTRLKLGLGIHIHMHANAERKARELEAKQAPRVSKRAQQALVSDLEATVRGLTWRPRQTTWSDYYKDTNYSKAAMSRKEDLIAQFLDLSAGPGSVVWDLGANTGAFSAVASKRASLVVAWDLDAAAVEKHYSSLRHGGESNILPLIQDFTNPSPSIGWDNEERLSLKARANADVLLALALIHHLAIGGNVPLNRIAKFMASLGRIAIVEFVPKTDSQVRRLLASRKDIYSDYSAEGFERSFAQHFRMARKEPIEGTERTLYLWERSAA